MFLDVKATLDGRRTLVELVGHIAERLAIPFTVGGGVRTVDDAQELLGAGADKVAVNSAALERWVMSPAWSTKAGGFGRALTRAMARSKVPATLGLAAETWNSETVERQFTGFVIVPGAFGDTAL